MTKSIEKQVKDIQKKLLLLERDISQGNMRKAKKSVNDLHCELECAWQNNAVRLGVEPETVILKDPD